MLDREEKKPMKSSLLSNMLDKRVVEENAKEKNPGAYKRNRGKNGSKAMSYYLSEEIIGAIGLRSIKDSVSKSEVVNKALELYLENEIEEINILRNR